METIIISDENFDNTSRGYLAFPYNEDQFKSFITGLLGRPQTLSRPIYGQFEIYLKDLQNIHELLEQRVTQQNAAKLVQFKSTLYFSDESSILLGSYEELITYNEIRPISTVAIQMSWVYLIKFPDKDVPEKQEIVISIKTNSLEEESINDNIAVVLLKKEVFFNNSITYEIAYTARTWGFDIDKLLNDHLTSIIITPHPFNVWVNRYAVMIGGISGTIFFIGGLYSMNHVYQNGIKQKNESSNDIINNLNIDQKINFLITQFNNLDFSGISSTVYFILIMMFSSIFALIITKLCSLKIGSYIILTREDLKSLSKKKKNEGINYLKLFLVFLSAILIEWIGAFTYGYMSK